MPQTQKQPANARRQSIHVALIYELLKADRGASAADFVETVKCRCAKLRIPYTTDRIWAALDHVERLRGSPWTPVGIQARHLTRERAVAVFGLNRQEAADLYAQLMTKRRVDAVRSVPPAGVRVRTNDRVKATRLAWQEILDQIEVCEQAEGAARA